MLILSHKDKREWNSLVKSFEKWDVYYLHEYAISFMEHGDGDPLLIYYEDINCRLCYVVMLNDISEMHAFKGKLLPRKYFDLTTPYGYGGPLIDGNFSDTSKRNFRSELYNYCVSENIVSEFFRFHPLLNNQMYLEDMDQVVELKKTIVIDTMSHEKINNNMVSKCRNMIRKAEKMGISIKYDSGENIDEFIKIYESTMKNNHAETYYYFERKYYDYILDEMASNTIIFYSYFEESIISAAIFFYNEKYMHYHLSGTLKEYRHMASMNLLLNKASLWASDHGISVLHLGGGVDQSDSLFKFKKQFNKNGELPFYIGRNIFSKELYDELLSIRKKNDENFNMNNSYLIQYRKE